MTVDYDIAIIGAGPAGCACALALHGEGLRVALIDKEVYPRDKICGDAIPGLSFKAMDHINKKWGSQMRALADKTEITTSTAFFPKNKSISYTWASYSYNSKRKDFDHFLFELVKKETNTILLEGKKLQRISNKSDHIQCVFSDGSSVNALMVIGCDGANSIVKRQLSSSNDNKSKPVAAIRAYYKNIEGIKRGVNEFHFIKDVHGYFWIFPLHDGWVNVGFGILKKKNAKNTTSENNIRHTLEQIIKSPAFAERFKNATLMENVNGFGLPIWTNNKTNSGDRFILCGDAASLIDPLQGHGIDKAMWSGILAARQIVDCFRQHNFSYDFIKQYDAMLYKKLGCELSRNYVVMRILMRFPFLTDIVLKLFSNQRVTNWVIRKMKI